MVHVTCDNVPLGQRGNGRRYRVWRCWCGRRRRSMLEKSLSLSPQVASNAVRDSAISVRLAVKVLVVIISNVP